MNHRNSAQFGQAIKAGKKFVVVHHQRAFVGQEMLECVDAALFDHRFHLVEHLFAPPRHRHVKRIIAIRAG